MLRSLLFNLIWNDKFLHFTHFFLNNKTDETNLFGRAVKCCSSNILEWNTLLLFYLFFLRPYLLFVCQGHVPPSSERTNKNTQTLSLVFTTEHSQPSVGDHVAHAFGKFNGLFCLHSVSTCISQLYTVSINLENCWCKHFQTTTLHLLVVQAKLFMFVHIYNKYF